MKKRLLLWCFRNVAMTKELQSGNTFRGWKTVSCYIHLNLVQWLHRHRVPGCDCDTPLHAPRFMDWAALYGGLDVVKFLHCNRNERCTTRAMDWAACKGDLPLVQFLHENRTEGCTQWAMMRACCNGYLDIAKFLYEKRNMPCCVVQARNFGRHDIVQWWKTVEDCVEAVP